MIPVNSTKGKESTQVNYVSSKLPGTFHVFLKFIFLLVLRGAYYYTILCKLAQKASKIKKSNAFSMGLLLLKLMPHSTRDGRRRGGAWTLRSRVSTYLSSLIPYRFTITSILVTPAHSLGYIPQGHIRSTHQTLQTTLTHHVHTDAGHFTTQSF